MNNVYLGGIGTTTKKQLRKDYDFSDAEFRKYFIQNPQMNKLFLSAYDWIWGGGGTTRSYDRKMANMSNKLHRYHIRFEKLAKQICEKLGIDYDSSNIEIATFNDALSNFRSYFSMK
jgi:hypothetical protein